MWGSLRDSKTFGLTWTFFIVVSVPEIWKEPETFHVLKELKPRFRSHVWGFLRDSKTFLLTCTFLLL